MAGDSFMEGRHAAVSTCRLFLPLIVAGHFEL